MMRGGISPPTHQFSTGYHANSPIQYLLILTTRGEPIHVDVTNYQLVDQPGVASFFFPPQCLPTDDWDLLARSSMVCVGQNSALRNGVSMFKRAEQTAITVKGSCLSAPRTLACPWCASVKTPRCANVFAG